MPIYQSLFHFVIDHGRRARRSISRPSDLSPKGLRSFIVALIDNIHVPFAAGYLEVSPGEELTASSSKSITKFFCDSECWYELSRQKCTDGKWLYSLFIRSGKGPVVLRSSHNLGRFDGIMLLRFYADRGEDYDLKESLSLWIARGGRNPGQITSREDKMW